MSGMPQVGISADSSNLNPNYLTALYADEQVEHSASHGSVKTIESKTSSASDVQHESASSGKYTFAENLEWAKAYFCVSKGHLFYIKTPDAPWSSCPVMSDYYATRAKERGARNVEGLSCVQENDELTTGKTAGEYLAELRQSEEDFLTSRQHTDNTSTLSAE